VSEVVFKTYPKVFRVGHKNTQGIFNKGIIVVEEKLDGANVRWMYDTSRSLFRFGSRKVELTEAKDPGQFRKFVEWLNEHISFSDLEEDHIYFAEYMIPHTIQYDWDKTPLIIGFDVYNCNTEKFIPLDEAIELFKNIKVPFVPVIDQRPFYEITPDYLDKVIPQSKYYNGTAEGVVFKNYETQQLAKLIAEGFKEVNEQTFGKGKKAAKKQSNEEYILEKYCPPRRIEKVIKNLVEEWNLPLDMKLMTHLPKKVWNDIIEEEASSILNENITINLPRLRKMITKRCVNVLQRCMALNEMGVF